METITKKTPKKRKNIGGYKWLIIGLGTIIIFISIVVLTIFIVSNKEKRFQSTHTFIESKVIDKNINYWSGGIGASKHSTEFEIQLREHYTNNKTKKNVYRTKTYITDIDTFEKFRIGDSFPKEELHRLKKN